MTSRTRIRSVPALLLLLALGVGAAGCSDGGGGDSADAGSSDVAAMEGPADRDAGATSTRQVTAAADDLADERALIKRGNVSLRADDVETSQREVQQVVDEYAGEVAEDETTTGDDGKAAYARMVLRVPATHFDDAVADLEEAGQLDSSSTNSVDVTEKVIDTETRLKAQRRSIARITTLLDQATSIREIMAIEGQLTSRQAELDSLEQRAAYLADQTSMSTITVSIDQIPAVDATVEDDAGFVKGLSAGWHGLTAFASGLATVVGALVPWLAVGAVIGIPVLLVVRSARRRRTAPDTPAEV